jgi:cytochrome c2
VIAAATAFLLLGAPVVGADNPEEQQLPDNPLEGRALFEEKRCLQCHAVVGSGAHIGPSLAAGSFGGTFLELGAALWNHVPGMSVTMESAGLDWPELSTDEVRKLVTFLYSIAYLGRPGDPNRGERLFRAKGCSSCHTIGDGDHVGPDLAALDRFASPLFIAQGIWNHGPTMLASMRAEGIPPPTFEDGDLADLSAFIRRRTAAGPQTRLLLAPGNPNKGRELFSSKACATCHGGTGGGDLGPSLRRADLRLSAEAIAGDMWNHALAMRGEMRQLGIGWPEFKSSELADLIAYLYFLPFSDPQGNAERGETVFTDRACASCHVADESTSETDSEQAPALAGTQASAAAFVSALWNHAPVMKEEILSEGHPWPELTGDDLRNLHAFLKEQPPRP